MTPSDTVITVLVSAIESGEVNADEAAAISLTAPESTEDTGEESE